MREVGKGLLMRKTIDEIKNNYLEADKFEEEAKRKFLSGFLKRLVITLCILLAIVSYFIWGGYTSNKNDLLEQSVFERMHYISLQNKDSDSGVWKFINIRPDGFLYYFSGNYMDSSFFEDDYTYRYMYKQLDEVSFEFFVNGNRVVGQFINYYTNEDLNQNMTLISYLKDGVPGRDSYKGNLDEGQLKLIDENGVEYILDQE